MILGLKQAYPGYFSVVGSPCFFGAAGRRKPGLA
jgi:hypothetical protein